MLTIVHKHQLLAFYVTLSEVQNVSGGGALQSQVAIAGWCHYELQPFRWSVSVLRTEIACGYLCDRTHPHLKSRKETRQVSLAQHDYKEI